MQKSDLRQEFLQMAPLMSRLYASIDYDRNSVKVVITPVYRAGVRMLDAWRTATKARFRIRNGRHWMRRKPL